MAETLQDVLLTSPSGKKMLSRVSPIYADSYVGLQMFQAIGLEYDKLWDIVESLPSQLFPETTTWAIELWEKRYHITPLPNQSIEDRRKRIINARNTPKPFNPATLEQAIYNFTGRTSEVKDNVGPYTFGVYINSDEDGGNIDIDEIVDYIRKHKPSHLSYELGFQTVSEIKVTVLTQYWRFPYSFAGMWNAGMLPDTAVLPVLSDSSVNVDGKETKGYVFPYPLEGTQPDTNTLAALSDSRVVAEASATGYKFAYPMTNETLQAGTEPDVNTLAALADGKVAAASDATGYKFDYPMTSGDTQAGTAPDVNIISVENGPALSMTDQAEGYKVSYPLCGTLETGAGNL